MSLLSSGLKSSAARLGKKAAAASYSVAGSIAGKGAAALGIGQIVLRHPWESGMAAFAVGSIISSQSDVGQINAAPSPVGRVDRPGVAGGRSASDYDLGATGDLIFALHRNR